MAWLRAVKMALLARANQQIVRGRVCGLRAWDDFLYFIIDSLLLMQQQRDNVGNTNVKIVTAVMIYSFFDEPRLLSWISTHWGHTLVWPALTFAVRGIVDFHGVNRDWISQSPGLVVDHGVVVDESGVDYNLTTRATRKRKGVSASDGEVPCSSTSDDIKGEVHCASPSDYIY